VSAPIDLTALAGVIADHRILPPPGILPPDSEELRAALGEIARGSRSTQATELRRVAAARHVPVEELARRAGFVLACLALPSSGTHYELLGVAPTASSREIRQRWATLIRRYHPDRAGSEGGLGEQARRLIEAYQTLRDRERRRRYDAELAAAPGERVIVSPVEAPGSWRRLAPRGRWRWAPAAIAVAGLLVVVAIVRWPAHAPTGAPRPAPRPLAAASTTAAPLDPGPAQPDRPPGATSTDVPQALAESTPVLPPLPSLRSRLAGSEAPPAPSDGEPVGHLQGDDGGVERGAGGTPRGPRAPELHGASASPGESGGSPAAAIAPPLPESAAAVGHHARKTMAPAALTAATPPVPSAESAVALAPDAKPAAPAATTAAPARSAGKAPAREGWATLIDAFRGAYERKDVAALDGLFADDVRERTAVGRGAVQRLYAANFQALDDIRYELSQMSARPGPREGELLVSGRFRIRAVDARNGARPLDVSGPIRWTLRREGETLRIVGIDYETGRR
jgi:hypothetical protein